MRRFWLMVVVALLCGLFVSGLAAVMAQEGGAAGGGTGGAAAATPAPEKTGEGATTPEVTVVKGESTLEMVLKYSGWPGWLIIISSFIAIYLVARDLYYFRNKEMLPPELVQALEADLDARRVREAVEKCVISDSVLARVVKAGLVEIRSGYDAMVAAMQEEGEAQSLRLTQEIGWLSVIAAIAPMLGLLGTVLGMMAAFGTISKSATQPAPAQLAGDIQLALVTTCEGLVVAVPVMIAYAYLRNKINTIMVEIGIVASALVDRFKGVEITPAMTAGVLEAAGLAPTTPEAGVSPEVPSESPPPEEGAPPPPPPV
jgi:biopolymer transport protein ExbB